ncbi:MAG: hypothetical protein IPP98_15610 [Gemmatimonadetes bacterium]|nr:hypothetical protein [Gemmatimonadota bacterium]MBL0180519.1 hypothetical protein [Gemmatimonadota bacterium]
MSNRAWCRPIKVFYAGLWVAVATAAQPLQAQSRDPVEGEYLLTVVRGNVPGRALRNDSLLLVLTGAPIPSSLARRMRGVELERGPRAATHGACWRSVSADPSIRAQSAPTHSQWKATADTFAVLLWAGMDAGERLQFTIGQAGARGFLEWWGHILGSGGRDSLIVERRGPADPAKCLP